LQSNINTEFDFLFFYQFQRTGKNLISRTVTTRLMEREYKQAVTKLRKFLRKKEKSCQQETDELPSRTARKTNDQLQILRDHFEINNRPSKDHIQLIARSSELSTTEIETWFRNALYRERQSNRDLSSAPHNDNQVSSRTFSFEEYEATGQGQPLPTVENNCRMFSADAALGSYPQLHPVQLASPGSWHQSDDGLAIPSPTFSIESDSVSITKRAKTKFSVDQINVLQEFFKNKYYPDRSDLASLSKLLNLKTSVLLTWFYHARRKLKQVLNQQPPPVNEPEGFSEYIHQSAFKTHYVTNFHFDEMNCKKSALLLGQSAAVTQIAAGMSPVPPPNSQISNSVKSVNTNTDADNEYYDDGNSVPNPQGHGHGSRLASNESFTKELDDFDLRGDRNHGSETSSLLRGSSRERKWSDDEFCLSEAHQSRNGFLYQMNQPEALKKLYEEKERLFKLAIFEIQQQQLLQESLERHCDNSVQNNGEGATGDQPLDLSMPRTGRSQSQTIPRNNDYSGEFMKCDFCKN